MKHYDWLRQQVEYVRDHRLTECIEWPFTTIKGKGYGQVYNGERMVLTHRAAYAIFNGIEPEYYVCHHCDNPPCFNPLHLYDGTPEDNAADMVKRGRANGGDRKLTETHIQEIIDLLQDSNLTQKEIGKRFGVTHSVISNINRGHIWKHIPRPIPVRSRYMTRPGKSTILTEEDGREIADLLDAGTTQVEIAQRFGVSQEAISRIKLGKVRAFRNIVQPDPRNGKHKLTEADVIKIIELLKLGKFTQAKIAQRFGVDKNTVTAIKSGMIWKHIPRPNTWPSSSNRKLTEGQVIEIISMIAAKVPRKNIAEKFNISIWTVRAIRRGKRWEYLPRPWL